MRTKLDSKNKKGLDMKEITQGVKTQKTLGEKRCW